MQINGVMCCAPPLSDELLDQYSNHIHQLPEGAIKDAWSPISDEEGDERHKRHFNRS